MTALNSEGFLPCPLCGSAFKIGQEPHDNGRVAGLFYIYHDYGPLGSSARNCPVEVSKYFGSREEAIAAWNRRALPPVDGLEVVDGTHLWVMEEIAATLLSGDRTAATKLRAAIDHFSQASSLIAGLKEAKEALMRERTSLIETKREQIERLTKERDEAVDNGHDWFNVSQDRMARIYSLEEQIKRLREALEPFAEAANDAEQLQGHDGPLGQYIDYAILCAARQALEDHNG